jgi:hypothetical protein
MTHFMGNTSGGPFIVPNSDNSFSWTPGTSLKMLVTNLFPYDSIKILTGFRQWGHGKTVSFEKDGPSSSELAVIVGNFSSGGGDGMPRGSGVGQFTSPLHRQGRK